MRSNNAKCKRLLSTHAKFLEINYTQLNTIKSVIISISANHLYKTKGCVPDHTTSLPSKHIPWQQKYMLDTFWAIIWIETNFLIVIYKYDAICMYKLFVTNIGSIGIQTQKLVFIDQLPSIRNRVRDLSIIFLSIK